MATVSTDTARCGSGPQPGDAASAEVVAGRRAAMPVAGTLWVSRNTSGSSMGYPRPAVKSTTAERTTNVPRGGRDT